MRELLTEIDIEASPETVWSVLSDFRSYPEWNPFMRRMKGKMQRGERLETFLKPPKGKGMTIKPTVKEVIKEKEFRWLGHLAGVNFLFNGEHYFKLQRISDKRTRLSHGEVFSGILVPMLWKNLNSDTREGFLKFNEAIKARSERIAG
jgi:hypothetical protein